MTIDIAEVQPTLRELRPIRRGWGVFHWIILLPANAFLFGFLTFGLIASSIGGHAAIPLLFVVCLAGAYLFWAVSGWVVHRITFSITKRAPAGRLVWDWSIGEEGVDFSNGLQVNRLDWRAVMAVEEERDRFVFLVMPGYNPALPKRLLSPEQLAALRNLLADLRSSGRLGQGLGMTEMSPRLPAGR